MIGKIIYDYGRTYICDDCHTLGKFKSYKAARRAGWAIARDYKTCYCPNCAPMHRNVGCRGFDCEYAAKIHKI